MKMLLAEPRWMRKDTVTADDRWEFCLRERDGARREGSCTIKAKFRKSRTKREGVGA